LQLACICRYAVQCAAEVFNYFPFKLEVGSYTTPFELAHGSKLGTTLNKFDSQS
jgi:hypothetical protein